MASKLVPDAGKPKPPNAGKGRPKGVPNKTTALLKDAILKAAEKAGNTLGGGGEDGLVDYLEAQAVQNPTAFMALLGKVLPMQLAGMGEGGEHLTEITFRVFDGKAGD